LTVIAGRVIPGFLIALLLLPSAGHSASITNRDDKDHLVTIIEGSTQKDHILKPNAVLDGVCEKGCLIRLGDSREDPFELEGSEITSIEEGQLYDDEAGVSSETGSGTLDPRPGAQPSQPGSRP
jgi:hypothetical protein